MYYIYYIPGIPKIGCSVRPEYRIRKQLKWLGDYSILESHNSPVIAHQREAELQDQYGCRSEPGYLLNQRRWQLSMTPESRKKAKDNMPSMKGRNNSVYGKTTRYKVTTPDGEIFIGFLYDIHEKFGYSSNLPMFAKRGTLIQRGKYKNYLIEIYQEK